MVITYLPNELALKIDGAKTYYLYSTVKVMMRILWRVGVREGCKEALPVKGSGASFSADLGGSSKYSSENLVNRVQQLNSYILLFC